MVNLKKRRAQTALELAVFGSILIFVMGSIIKSTLGRAQQQHVFLKATRLALTLSHYSTETKHVSGRNMGTVFIVEDRLTAASSKYGAIDRIPMMMQGTGVHSANLFMPIWFNDEEDLPVFDMYVNGQRFAFRTARFKSVQLARSCEGATDPKTGSCPVECANCDPLSPYYYPGEDIPPPGLPLGDGSTYWEPDCVTATTTTTTTESCAGLFPCPADCTDCSNTSLDTHDIITETTNSIGCAKLYTIVENHPLIPEWCNDEGPPFGIPCPPGNLSANERFNLDRADATFPEGLDGIPGTITVPPAERTGFDWQWMLVAPVTRSAKAASYNYSAAQLALDPLDYTDTRTTITSTVSGQSIILPGGDSKPRNISLDVDYDLKLETIMPNIEEGPTPNSVSSSGIITRIGVLDQQEGDIDLTYNDSDTLSGIEPFGFTKDVNFYSFVHSEGGKGGTYLQIDEGKLFSASGDERQYIRTASKKDQVDLIERVWRLSNNTGGYCYDDNGDGTFERRDDDEWRAFYKIRGNTTPNPVEYCREENGCFDADTINATCMDTTNNLIFIRSRLEDLHGRKWVTDTSEDPYVNLNTD